MRRAAIVSVVIFDMVAFALYVGLRVHSLLNDIGYGLTFAWVDVAFLWFADRADSFQKKNSTSGDLVA